MNTRIVQPTPKVPPTPREVGRYSEFVNSILGCRRLGSGCVDTAELHINLKSTTCGRVYSGSTIQPNVEHAIVERTSGGLEHSRSCRARRTACILVNFGRIDFGGYSRFGSGQVDSVRICIAVHCLCSSTRIGCSCRVSKLHKRCSILRFVGHIIVICGNGKCLIVLIGCAVVLNATSQINSCILCRCVIRSSSVLGNTDCNGNRDCSACKLRRGQLESNRDRANIVCVDCSYTACGRTGNKFNTGQAVFIRHLGFLRKYCRIDFGNRCTRHIGVRRITAGCLNNAFTARNISKLIVSSFCRTESPLHRKRSFVRTRSSSRARQPSCQSDRTVSGANRE